LNLIVEALSRRRHRHCLWPLGEK